MKKHLKLLLCAAIGIGTFTACEDVPEPYNIPSENITPVVPTADYIFNQTFTSSLGDFTTQSESGSIAWAANSRYGAIISGYDDWDGSGTKTNKPGVTYLISPAIELADCDSAYVEIEQAVNYAKTTLDDDHKLLIAPAPTDGGPVATMTAFEELPMSMDGLGTSFTYITQYIQIPDKYIGQKVQLALKHTAHDSYSSTWEVKSFKVAKGQAPASTSPETPVEGLVGSGTIDDPYTSASALLIASALSSGGQTNEAFYIKGKVVSIKEQFSAQYGNASFYISDDGSTTDQFYVFRALYLGNKKWSNGDKEIQVGDEVIVYAKLTNYQGNTPETVQGATYLYSLNGETAGGDEPGGDAKGTGTLEDPLNSVAANNIASALASNAKTDQAYYIKGKVVSVKEQFSTQYGNASFYISDDGTSTDQFYIFRALYLGNQKWVSGNKQLKAGDEVIVYAKLTNYQGNTPETVQGDCYIYSLNGATEDDGSNPGDEPTPGTSYTKLADFNNGGFETWTDGVPAQWMSTNTASTKNTVSQSTDAHSGSYSVNVAGSASGNQRLASTELTLEAGDYTIEFYIKPEADGGSVRPGYVPVKDDGSVGSYVYGDYVNDIPAGQWTKVTHTFSLGAATNLNLVLMNPKKPGKNFLIDDFTITKN